MRRLAAFSWSPSVLVLLVPGLGACAQRPTRGDGVVSSPPTAMTTMVDASPTGAAPDSDVPPAANANGEQGRDPGADASSPKLCGCGLCAPVVSDDACAKDSDCAPETPCHATRCVGLAHAAPRPSGTMCTQVLACASVDANHCGCLAGKCALSPRGDAPR